MYSQANIFAMLPTLPPIQLNPTHIIQPDLYSSNTINNNNNIISNLPTSTFHPYLLPSPSVIPLKSQILAEIGVELQKLKYLESLLFASEDCLPTSSTSLQPTISLPCIHTQIEQHQHQQLQYPFPPSAALTPPSSSSTTTIFPSTTSTPISLVQTNERKKIRKTSSSASSLTESCGDRPYQCNQCSKKFKFKSNLFEHKSLHSIQQTYQYVCPFCSKSCRLKGNLKKHLQIHMGTAEQLERYWKVNFSRSSGRPRKIVSKEVKKEKINDDDHDPVPSSASSKTLKISDTDECYVNVTD